MFDINAANTTCMNCFTQHSESLNPCPNCGYNEFEVEPSPHLLRPRTILNGKYLVGRVIGQGGFGITYVGFDLNLGLRIALKEYYPTGFVTRETTSTSAATVQPFTGSEGEFFLKGREKFINEARSLAKFYTLPGIVSVKDYFLENGTAYITMEFIDGQTLKEYVAVMGGKLLSAQVFDLMKPVMSSLAEVHKTGIIHRDISPDNIMISSDGYLKLLDFGAARDFTETGNKSMSVMLKPGFAPEEQYRTKGEQGPWTDIYALCATMYRCITGITPEESVERVRKDNVLPPSSMGIAIDPRKEQALMMGMAVLQDKRFQSISAIYSAMFGEPLKTKTSTMVTQKTQQEATPAATIPTPVAAPPAASFPQQQAPGYHQPPQQQAVQPAMGQQYQRPQAYTPQTPPYTPPMQPQKSGGWISNNKALAGILGGVLLLVIALGVVLLIMFLPGGGSDTGGTPGITVSPPPTFPDIVDPPPTIAPDASILHNTAWELDKVRAEGLTLDRQYLESVGLNIIFWFLPDGTVEGLSDSDLGYGTWRLSGNDLTMTIDGDTINAQLDGNTFIWYDVDAGEMTFLRNDDMSYYAFNPPSYWYDPNPGEDDPYALEDHFLKGMWWFADGFWLYHFGSSAKIIFLGNGSVYSEEDDKWATWSVVEVAAGRNDGKDRIQVITEWGSDYYFLVNVDEYNRLTIEDHDGDRTYYDRGAYDSPVGEWTFYDSNNSIYFYGTSNYISFDVYGNTYGSEYDYWGYWWMEDYFTMLVQDRYNDYIHRFWFGTYGDFLTIFDEDNDFVTFQRVR